jgi:hypothetical protein
MTIKKYFQDTATSLLRRARDTVVDQARDTLEGRNETAEERLRAQINLVAVNAKKFGPFRTRKNRPLRAHNETLTDSSAALQNHVLKTNAALTLYPNASRTILIKRFLTGSQNKLIEETQTADGRKKLAIWNEKTRSRDTYEEIYTEKSRNGGAQYTSYYDATNRRISINLAGTVFTNIDDLKSASQTITESAVSMRMTRVKDCIDQMVDSFNKLYPGQIEKMPIDIYAHSAGACSVPVVNYFLQRAHGLVPRSQIMIDPFGAKNSFQKFSEMVGQAEGRDSKEIFDELSRNTVTFKPAHHSFVEEFKKLHVLDPALGHSPETVGRVKVADVGGNSFTAHQIRTWVRYFNNAEISDIKTPGVKNKPTGKRPAA